MSLDLDVQLREFCDFMDETQGPLTIDDILERTGEVPVIPGRIRVIRGGPVSRRLITAAAAVIAIVLVGLALRFLPVLQGDVPPATDDIPTTTNSTAPPPEGAEAGQGTLETPMGTFNWWKLIGVDGELPDPGWLVKSESGYSLVVGPFGDTLEYWRSADGKTWLPAPSPGFEGASGFVVVLAGDYWLTTEEPVAGVPNRWRQSSVWRSDDGETWIEVPLPAGYTQTPFSLHDVDGEIWLTTFNTPSTVPLGVWRLDGTSWTSLDPGSFPSGDITELDGWTGVEGGPAAAGGITVVPWDFDSLTVIGANDQGVVVTPPWAALRNEVPEGQAATPSLTVLASDGQFLAYVTHYIPGTTCPPTRPGCVPEPQATFDLWTSPDGVNWTGPTPPGFLVPEGAWYGSFRSEGDVILAELYGDPSPVWTSEDGINWSNSGIPGQGGEFVRLDSGAIYLGSYPHLEMFFSADLRNWERVDMSAVGAFGGSGSGASMTAAAGDTVFFMVLDEGSGRHAMWILELEE